MEFFGPTDTNPGFTEAASSAGGRGVPPRRRSDRTEGLDLNSPPSDLHFGMPCGKRSRSAPATAFGEAGVAGVRRGAIPPRAAGAARGATDNRTRPGGTPAGTAARRYPAPRRATKVRRPGGRPPVGGRSGVGGGAGVAAGGPYDGDAALSQESQGSNIADNGAAFCSSDGDSSEVNAGSASFDQVFSDSRYKKLAQLLIYDEIMIRKILEMAFMLATYEATSSRKRGSRGANSTSGMWQTLLQQQQELHNITEWGLQNIIEKQKREDAEEDEEIKRCFQSARQCGILPVSADYMKCVKIFKEKYSGVPQNSRWHV